jgi:D-glycero-beta-D-manno-heptose-7-phosphate kinase
VTDRRLLVEALDGIRGRRFLVVGDLYLDAYIFGQPSRVSREAPIMVLEESREEQRPGGGAAPALVLAALGAAVWQAGIVGDDPEGESLRRLLESSEIDAGGVLVDPARPTTTKTRLVAEGAYNVFPQQIARVDRQRRAPVSDELRGRMAATITEIAAGVDAVLLSDYRSGVIVPEIVDAVRASASLATVDSQGALREFRGLDLIKCNQAEAESVLGVQLTDPSVRAERLPALRHELDTPRLTVTLGPAGAAISTDDGYHEVPSLIQRQVFDVTGAGDTVIAVLTGAIAGGADDLTALRLSQIAAGLVVAKWGNAQATTDEILAAIGEAEMDGAL